MENAENLIGLIRGKNINPVEKDKLVWNATNDGSYSMKFNMDVMAGGIGAVSFPKIMVWNQLVPSKVHLIIESAQNCIL